MAFLPAGEAGAWLPDLLVRLSRSVARREVERAIGKIEIYKHYDRGGVVKISRDDPLEHPFDDHRKKKMVVVIGVCMFKFSGEKLLANHLESVEQFRVPRYPSSE